MNKLHGPVSVSILEWPGFPSASSIEFHKGLLYLIGDDARNIAVLDSEYKLIDSIVIFPGEDLRIPKKAKADLEASTVYKDALLVTGSASTPEREYLWLFPFVDLAKHRQISIKAFIAKLLHTGVKQVNFEGLATVNDLLIFGNRGNTAIPNNELIIVDGEQLDSLENARLHIIDFDLNDSAGFKGVSGLAYLQELDLLLFTASTELTSNNYDDGDIGDSYLGYVKDFSSKLKSKKINPDLLINLSQSDAAFRDQKIESVAVESFDKNELVLHLVADNDNGISKIFKVRAPNPLK